MMGGRKRVVVIGVWVRVVVEFGGLHTPIQRGSKMH
jgi:hypothetical protein